MTTVRVAACHAAPIFLNARRTADKAVNFITEAASNGAKVIVFPETFIPGFPFWNALRSPAENHDLFKRLVQESVGCDSEEMRAVQGAAKQHKVIVSIGLSEKAKHSNATLFNSNTIYGADGKVLVHHRKLVATFFEKLTWSPGDGAGLRVACTSHGRIGQLICGDNTKHSCGGTLSWRRASKFTSPPGPRPGLRASCQTKRYLVRPVRSKVQGKIMTTSPRTDSGLRRIALKQSALV